MIPPRSPPDRAIYATLLTAQGRFLFDLFIAEQDGRYLVDCAAPRRADLVKRLSMYRLRSKVTIADADADWCVAVLFGDGAAAAVGLGGEAGSAAASWRRRGLCRPPPAGSWRSPDPAARDGARARSPG